MPPSTLSSYLYLCSANNRSGTSNYKNFSKRKVKANKTYFNEIEHFVSKSIAYVQLIRYMVSCELIKRGR